MVVSLSITAQLSNIVLLPKIGPRPLIPVGMLMSAIALFMLTKLGVSSSYATHVFPRSYSSDSASASSSRPRSIPQPRASDRTTRVLHQPR